MGIKYGRAINHRQKNTIITLRLAAIKVKPIRGRGRRRRIFQNKMGEKIFATIKKRRLSWSSVAMRFIRGSRRKEGEMKPARGPIIVWTRKSLRT
jgi:hypothetical protein